MRKIIIDCDPGHDDAIALLAAYADKNNFEVLAVGCVGGNHYLEKITQNARLILQTIGAKTPLYAGCFQPLVQALPVQPGAHGESGMDGLSSIPKLFYPLNSMHAIQGYYDILSQTSDVTLVALGPLTNLATLFQMYPAIKDSISEISLMGGGVDHGNVTPYAEFNIFADPEAARIVFESGVPITMSGLDVSEKAYLTYEEIVSLKHQGSVSHFAYELLEFYYTSGKQFGFEVAAMHDATAVAVLAHPEWFVFEHLPIEISCEGITRGMTCADKRLKKHAKANVKVAMEVNRDQFAKYLLDAITSYDREIL